ncbi:hypothetical protein PAXRUDRAFT_353677 [Paxillus rubicundulus Ve08.2h10]|uniref:Uncharacterized protein n=1 Tax=Paxillus rubicundulus Ve08.2h10 TaxID=930991 RepID=A0A0D0DZB8_9AGAM|nr:hypothetical protein PAXRUDRAFT_353677 [Paxillus rubicundulus Ve08.2h10]
MNHPYGASSSYLYANVHNQSRSRDHYIGYYNRNASPQLFESFVPRFSSDSIPHQSLSSATEYTVTGGSSSSGMKNLYFDDEDSLSPRTSLGKRIWKTLKELGGSVRRRWPLRRSSFPVFVHPCHRNVDNDSGDDYTSTMHHLLPNLTLGGRFLSPIDHFPLCCCLHL